MQYRRATVPGGSYFFTVVTAGRRHVFTCGETVQALRDAFRAVMVKRPFQIDASVVLPDHLHCIWTLPEGDADYATRWRLIKTHFMKAIRANAGTGLSDYAALIRPTNTAAGLASIWQNRYWEHLLRDESDFNSHVDYIHYNPVKHGYVEWPSDWPWSSLRTYIAKGILSSDWGNGNIDFPGDIGRE